eukprot:CAMPEP_0170605724 /NCGR_PEP_ID=MMETSP0224-20130122/20125_1 /TAXON_ID=285029 /ORGANISM="Togula jolla, Strain CCCM 725" /LENGTH=141 /DNA_ID=CAMNT_0010930745 /DNA_START=18 /DNA_END=439 /DNA_ORIENTATION=+
MPAMFDFCGMAGREDGQSKHLKSGSSIETLIQCFENTLVEERRRAEAKDQELAELRALVTTLCCSAIQRQDSAGRELEKNSMLPRMARQYTVDNDGRLNMPPRMARQHTVDTDGRLNMLPRMARQHTVDTDGRLNMLPRMA